MANAKNSLQSAVPVLVAGGTGAALGHFAGKGKNLLLGAALVLGADAIASKLPASVNATHLRTAGAVCMLVTPAAASANQSLSDFAKEGVNRLKGYGNALVMGTGVAKGPFTLSSGMMTIPAEVSGYGFIGETPYGDYNQLDEGNYSEYSGAGDIGYADVSTAGR